MLVSDLTASSRVCSMERFADVLSSAQESGLFET
jgi:hypothetical protein